MIVRVLTLRRDVAIAWSFSPRLSRPEHVNHAVMHNSGVRRVRGANTILEVIPSVEVSTIEQRRPRPDRCRYALRRSSPTEEADERKAQRRSNEKVTTIHLIALERARRAGALLDVCNSGQHALLNQLTT